VAASAPGPLRIGGLHLLTVGALGTLTLNVMANVTAARSRAMAGRDAVLNVGTALVALAAGARYAASLLPASAVPLLVVAAACWSGAFALLAALLLRSAGTPRAAGHAAG
jgi:uncharacterized protein involved in response to NO